MSISKNVDNLFKLISDEKLDTLGEVMNYFKEMNGYIPDESLVAVCILVQDGYISSELY
mgnify:CR=1 FL=1